MGRGLVCASTRGRFPGCSDLGYGLVEHAASWSERDSRRLVLSGVAADPYPEHEASLGELLDGGCLLRYYPWSPQRKLEHAGPDDGLPGDKCALPAFATLAGIVPVPTADRTPHMAQSA
jgi:hypothetical protein